MGEVSNWFAFFICLEEYMAGGREKPTTNYGLRPDLQFPQIQGSFNDATFKRGPPTGWKEPPPPRIGKPGPGKYKGVQPLSFPQVGTLEFNVLEKGKDETAHIYEYNGKRTNYNNLVYSVFKDRLGITNKQKVRQMMTDFASQQKPEGLSANTQVLGGARIG